MGNKSACARNGHRVEIESACAHDGGINVDNGDDEGKGNKSACARYGHKIGIEGACARDGGRMGIVSACARDGKGIGIESACALDIHTFYDPPDSSSQRELVLKIKQLVNVNYKYYKLKKNFNSIINSYVRLSKIHLTALHGSAHHEELGFWMEILLDFHPLTFLDFHSQI